MVGPRADQDRIPGIDIALRDGETWMFGEQPMRVIDTPGHTRGNLKFHFHIHMYFLYRMQIFYSNFTTTSLLSLEMTDMLYPPECIRIYF